jgi:uncharacterized membrane protein
MWSRLVRVGLLSVVVLGTVVAFTTLRPAAGSSALLAEAEEGEAGLTKVLGNQHVAIIHFPIALTIAAALAEVLALITRRPAFAHAARFCIVIAALGAIAAVITGWMKFGGEIKEVAVASIRNTLDIHRALGITAGIVIVATAVVSEVGRVRRNRWVLLAYRIALLAAVVLVAFTGYYGGKYAFPD